MFAVGSHNSEIILHIICYVSLVGWTLLGTFHLLGLFYSLYKFHRKRASANLKELPGISIIKPLTCIDSNLAANLETFFHLNYPRYEILFCVQEHDELLIDMIERLRTRYAHVASHLFVGTRSNKAKQEEKPDHDGLEENAHTPLMTTRTPRTQSKTTPSSCWRRIFSCGSQKSTGKDASSTTDNTEIKNPKIANMLAAYENAQYPFILISDGGMKTQEDTLYDMASLMAKDVGLVHQMPFSCDKQGFAGSLEKVYFGTQHARMYMTINFLGINCVTGMSCLIRKECLDRVGGLRAFGDYIAEDFYIAYEVSKQGWKLRVASTPALQNSGEYSIDKWIQRMIRWSKLRMRLSPLAYIEPLQECLLSAVIAGLVTNYLFDWNALVIAACHILVWFILDYSMLRITQGSSLPFSKSEFAVAWLIRELLSYYIYFKAFTGSSTIKWRGKEYRLGSGTRAEEIYVASMAPSSSPSVPSLHIETSASSTNVLHPVTASNLLSV